MSDYGVTDSGFVRPRLAEIKSDIEDALTEAFGVTISTDADSVLGQIIGVWSEREATLWEVAEDSYNAMYPNTATGTNLDNSVAFTGIQRISAEKTTIMATCYGTNGTTITADSQIKSSAV
ncbi:MAG: Mu-like prophage FluMu protein gp47 [Firmicutes bacterium]|nr:Mu-like prophage FluMu protein gp47 [Bacillota bacterium]